MSCQDCDTAAARMWSAYTLNCKGCIARGVGRSVHFRRCRDAGVQDRLYRQFLAQAQVTHEQVLEAVGKDFEMRGAGKVPVDCR